MPPAFAPGAGDPASLAPPPSFSSRLSLASARAERDSVLETEVSPPE